MPRPLGLLSVDTGPPNKGCGAVALTLHKVSRLSGVNKTDKAKVASGAPALCPPAIACAPGCLISCGAQNGARHPKASRMTRFRTIEPVIISVGTIALLLLGTGAVLVAWLFSA